MKTLQEEVGSWALYNFGEQDSHRPLLGILEELGELCEAKALGDVVEIRDAIGDTGIYILHYCHLNQWDSQAIWDGRFGPSMAIMKLVSALCHGQLKMEQGIRGDSMKHSRIIRVHLANLFWFLEMESLNINTRFQEVIRSVWSEVQKRDWRANPETGNASG